MGSSMVEAVPWLPMGSLSLLRRGAPRLWAVVPCPLSPDRKLLDFVLETQHGIPPISFPRRQNWEEEQLKEGVSQFL